MSWWTIAFLFLLTVLFSVFGAHPLARLHWYFLGNWYDDEEEEREKEKRAFRRYVLLLRGAPIWMVLIVLLGLLVGILDTPW